jgi:hypothetical protein
MYVLTAEPQSPYGARGGQSPASGVPVPMRVPASHLTRPTLAAIPVPAGESVYARKLQAAGEQAAAVAARRAGQAAIRAVYAGQDAAVRQAKLAATTGLNARAAVMAAALDAAAVPESDARTTTRKMMLAAEATARERLRITDGVAEMRGAVAVRDRTTGVVRLIDQASNPTLAAEYARRQASSYRPPYNPPAYVQAALAPSPADVANAAAVGTGAPSPAAVVQALADGVEQKPGLGATDALPASGVSVGIPPWMIVAALLVWQGPNLMRVFFSERAKSRRG